MSFLIPAPLKPGDTIAIVPTARAITVEELRDGIELAESWGIRVKLGAEQHRNSYVLQPSVERLRFPGLPTEWWQYDLVG